MQPTLNPGTYVFVSRSFPAEWLFQEAISIFREKEGITVILPEPIARANGLSYTNTFCWITLEVHSALEAVGLTAAFSRALAEATISCNVVAGYYHDHIFVPQPEAENAVKALQNLRDTWRHQ